MIRCPKCHAAILQSRAVCHFCGADVSAVRRRVTWEKAGYDPTLTTWVWYTFLSLGLVLAGGWLVAMAAGTFDRTATLFTAIAGVVTFGIALGLLLRIDLFRRHAQALCLTMFLAGVVAVVEGFYRLNSGQLGLWLCVGGAAISLLAGMLPGFASRTVTTWVR